MRSIITKYCKGDQIKEDEMGGAVARMGYINADMILVGIPEGKRPLKDLGVNGKTIRMDLRDVG
jgi:hypothetical protein